MRWRWMRTGSHQKTRTLFASNHNNSSLHIFIRSINTSFERFWFSDKFSSGKWIQNMDAFIQSSTPRVCHHIFILYFLYLHYRFDLISITVFRVLRLKSNLNEIYCAPQDMRRNQRFQNLVMFSSESPIRVWINFEICIKFKSIWLEFSELLFAIF